MTCLEVTVSRKAFSTTGVTALENLEFSAQAGEFLALVGPSGAGKTTLLNIVGGLDRDLAGTVHMNGEELSTKANAPVRVGYIFQEPRLMPWLSVLDNLRLVLDEDEQNRGLAGHLIEQVGLKEFEHAFPGQLSGGMQRRVALARAFAIRPGLLLMDEPFVSLDVPTGNKLRRQLMDLWSELKPIVLFVTHDLREALALADRVLFLSSRPGRVVLDLPVTLKRPRESDDRAVEELHRRLLSQHPDLLSGLVNPAAKQVQQWQMIQQ